MEPTRIGLIGCGRVAGLRHLPALARLPEGRIVAVADVNGERLAEIANRAGVQRRYASHSELLADPDVEAVAVLVPASEHAEVAAAALEAGKHVLLEKPVTLDLRDADRLVDVVRESPKSLLVAFNLRWHRLVREARRLIAAGAIGRPEALSTAFTSRFLYRHEAKAWRVRRQTGGGVLVEMASHHFDLWNYLLDDTVEEVSALARQGDFEDETATVHARTRNGTLITGVFSHRAPDSNEIDVRGDAGRVRVDLYAFDGIQVIPWSGRTGDPRRRLDATGRFLRNLPEGVFGLRAGGPFVASYTEEWRHFLAVCRGETSSESTVEDGREALRIMLGAAESAASGGTVSLKRQASGLVPVGAVP